jgi:peptidoglycan/xylan/chitin deacetylase (PgdA/CDA1 family)
MSVYQGKMLELLSIDQEADQSYIHIKLSMESDAEFRWQIDVDTAKQIKAVMAQVDSYKYRLSFQSTWDSFKEQHVSFLTRSYRDRSERLYFTCTEAYVNALITLKEIHELKKARSLPFLSVHPAAIGASPGELVKADRSVKPYLSRITIAFLGVVSAILAVYIGLFDMSDSVFEKPSAVETEILAVEAPAPSQIQTERLSLDSNPVQLLPIAAPAEDPTLLNLQDSPSVDPTSVTVPVIELSEGINYSLPEGHVAITFDDGPTEYSMAIMEVLNNYHVGGSFFFTGLNVEKKPEVVQAIHAKGFTIGSHSMNHFKLTGLTYADQEQELLQSNQLIEDLILEDVTLLRPPYGALNKSTLELVNQHASKIVLWNNDPQDWKGHDADEIFNAVVEAKTSGSIILLHESQAVVDALPKLIEYFQSKDLKVVSLK